MKIAAPEFAIPGGAAVPAVAAAGILRRFNSAEPAVQQAAVPMKWIAFPFTPALCARSDQQVLDFASHRSGSRTVCHSVAGSTS